MRSTSSSAGVVFGSHRKHLPDVLNDSGFCLVGMNWDLIVSWLEGESSLSSVVCSFHSSVVNIHKHVLDAFLFGRNYSKLNSTSFRSLFYSVWFYTTYFLIFPDIFIVGTTCVLLLHVKVFEVIFSFQVFFLSPAAKYREEFKLIIDRIAVVKSENVSEPFAYFYLLWIKSSAAIVSCVLISTLRHKHT